MNRATISPAGLAKLALCLCICFHPWRISALDMPGVPPVYRVALSPFLTPPMRTSGVLVKARVNDGPVLRLLLDSGAQHLVLDPKAAAKSGCVGGAEFDLVGAAAVSGAREWRAATVAVGDLTFRGVEILVADGALAEGIQGVIPLSLFSGYLIRLDIPGRTLELYPYSPDPAGSATGVQALDSDRLLFLKGTANSAEQGYFLLDTGASYNAISRSLARRLNLTAALAPVVPVQGGGWNASVPMLGNAVQLRFGATELARGPVVAVDLSNVSRYHNLDVVGLIGYPALADSVVTVSYRDGLVRFDPRTGGRR